MNKILIAFLVLMFADVVLFFATPRSERIAAKDKCATCVLLPGSGFSMYLRHIAR